MLIADPAEMKMTHWHLSRRKLFETVGAGTVAAAGWPAAAQTSPRSQADVSSRATLEPLNRFPQMMQEHLMAQVRRSGQASSQAIYALKTKAEAEAHVRTIRTRIQPASARSRRKRR